MTPHPKFEKRETKMNDELEKTLQFGEYYFVPGHLTRGLIGLGVAVGAGLVSLAAGGYALGQLKQVRFEEVEALLRGVE